MMGIRGILLVLCLASNGLGADAFKEGSDYQILDNPVQVNADIVEFFTYACVHCYHAEHEVNVLLRHKPRDVSFLRVPVSFGHQKAIVGAYAYYVAKRLDMLETVHHDLFKVVHEPDYKHNGAADNKEQQALLPDDVLQNTESLGRYFQYRGVNQDRYLQVISDVKKAGFVEADDRLAKSIKLVSTPSFLIRGRYMISGINQRHAGEKFADLVTYLLTIGATQPASHDQSNTISRAATATQY